MSSRDCFERVQKIMKNIASGGAHFKMLETMHAHMEALKMLEAHLEMPVDAGDAGGAPGWGAS